MIDVSTYLNDDATDRREPSSQPAGTATIESYETEDGVVFYDAENPLAWVETSRTLTLSELA
ncbi:hypothetical protein C488_12973 [Natrinema pellirubrum DSM 15624]|uniref:Uncharacterized protein n=1 Tax=Natrinema pellirubrum (strain DSM 15624 / CIP 106293 / JCM 10476 / NCIMB 786 / 157) TaxID=797303 RepID=L0JMT5_NATP1|nr:hypothetical protein [Natrinema pellirubrum]AGB32579.1 hypothetical protein Natpe_2777 [Natrinema pellirubrum DSM 15624]ELY73715.1 hypothetical protein C488_12973 [Natrinema pellirubrum DSM 15624]